MQAYRRTAGLVALCGAKREPELDATIQSIELTYTGPAGKCSMALEP